MEKKDIIVSILIFIIICLLCFLIVAVKNKKVEKETKNIYVTEEKRYESKEFDLNKISMNGLKLGDSSEGSKVIFDYDYREKEKIYIKGEDKITTLMSNENDKTEIKYENKSLKILADYIEILGQYSKKTVYYQNEYETYDYIYESYENSDASYIYTLTISCDKNNNIDKINLDKTQLYIMG